MSDAHVDTLDYILAKALASKAAQQRDIGDETARCVGFFSAATVESTFDQPIMPIGGRVAGTPPEEELARIDSLAPI